MQVVAKTTETVVVRQDWEVALEQLRATNEVLQRRKADAERDRELFRDMYSKASAHVSEVAKENEELLERATLAEGQVRDGLAMTKKTYEERVARLQGEVARLQGLNTILTARDVKMQGDELRRWAAEGVELKEENQRLRAELAELRMDYDRMEGLLEQLGEGELEALGEQEEELRDKAGVYVPQTPVDETPTPFGPIVTVEEV